MTLISGSKFVNARRQLLCSNKRFFAFVLMCGSIFNQVWLCERQNCIIAGYSSKCGSIYLSFFYPEFDMPITIPISKKVSAPTVGCKLSSASLCVSLQSFKDSVLPKKVERSCLGPRTTGAYFIFSYRSEKDHFLKCVNIIKPRYFNKLPYF